MVFVLNTKLHTNINRTQTKPIPTQPNLCPIIHRHGTYQTDKPGRPEYEAIRNKKS